MPFQSVSNFSIDLLLSAHSATLPTTTISSISPSLPFDFVAVHPPSTFSPLNLAKNGNFLFSMAFAPFQFWWRPSISASDLPSTPSSSSSSTASIVRRRKSAATVPPPPPSPLPSFSSVVAPSSAHSSAVLKFGHEKLLPKHQDKASNQKRRQRTIFSEEQLHLLEKAFRLTPYPEVNVRERLAERCELRTERVEVWFKNRRAKARKRAKESFKNA